jgi:hypothetical protein
VDDVLDVAVADGTCHLQHVLHPQRTTDGTSDQGSWRSYP